MVMASLSQSIPLPQTVVELEAIAARRPLDFSLVLGFAKAILDRDSQTVMIALQDDSPSHAFFGLLIQDAHLVADLFTCISSLHIGRDDNSEAHNLARLI
ncbi:hypothetical protein SO802_009054 [Lithocarpus litseifolius]|uniref:RNase H type-1 domain-containing protein n=1 Tax=Lithocarpus litseifolius TaxID=425828 RepID=A0AAW2DAB1_9ROSI